IGLVIAFVRDGGVNKYLVAHRTGGGNYPNQGWGISYFSNGSQTVLSNVATVGSGGNWLGRSSRVRIVRNGDLIRSWATPFGDLENYLGEMVIDLDANTVNGNHVGVNLSVFKGERQYGYYTYSQAESTYLDIVMEGGVARDVAILLTDGFDSDASGDADTWTG